MLLVGKNNSQNYNEAKYNRDFMLRIKSTVGEAVIGYRVSSYQVKHKRMVIIAPNEAIKLFTTLKIPLDIKLQQAHGFY